MKNFPHSNFIKINIDEKDIFFLSMFVLAHRLVIEVKITRIFRGALKKIFWDPF